MSGLEKGRALLVIPDDGKKADGDDDPADQQVLYVKFCISRLPQLLSTLQKPPTSILISSPASRVNFTEFPVYLSGAGTSMPGLEAEVFPTQLRPSYLEQC